jgi:hypothetical protein
MLDLVLGLTDVKLVFYVYPRPISITRLKEGKIISLLPGS